MFDKKVKTACTWCGDRDYPLTEQILVGQTMYVFCSLKCKTDYKRAVRDGLIEG